MRYIIYHLLADFLTPVFDDLIKLNLDWNDKDLDLNLQCEDCDLLFKNQAVYNSTSGS